MVFLFMGIDFHLLLRALFVFPGLSLLWLLLQDNEGSYGLANFH